MEVVRRALRRAVVVARDTRALAALEVRVLERLAHHCR